MERGLHLPVLSLSLSSEEVVLEAVVVEEAEAEDQLLLAQEVAVLAELEAQYLL